MSILPSASSYLASLEAPSPMKVSSASCYLATLKAPSPMAASAAATTVIAKTTTEEIHTLLQRHAVMSGSVTEVYTPISAVVSDAVATRMAEIRSEEERKKAETKKQIAEWEERAKREYDAEMITFEAKLRLAVEHAKTSDFNFSQNWRSLIPSTLKIRSTKTIDTETHSFNCGGWCIGEFAQEFGLPNPPTPTTHVPYFPRCSNDNNHHARPIDSNRVKLSCGACDAKMALIVMYVKPLIQSERDKALMERMSQEKIAAQKAAAEAAERAAKSNAKAHEWSATVASQYSRWQNNFSGIDPRTGETCFAVYMPEHKALKIVNIRYNLHFGSDSTRLSTPGDCPVSWNTHHTEGRIPFSPQCPICRKQNMILADLNGGVSQVYCNGDSSERPHYRWIAEDNKSEVFKYSPPTPTYDYLGRPYCPLGYTPSYGTWEAYDIMDPDGKKAAALKKEKEITDIKAQMEALKKQLATLGE